MDETMLQRMASLLDGEPIVNQTAGQAGSLDHEIRTDLNLALAQAFLKRGALESAGRILNMVSQDVAGVRKSEIARHYLRLAEAYRKQPDSQDGATTIESCLVRAVALAPELGVPAFAQYLQKEKRLREAIKQWQKAIALQPGEPNYYLTLAGLYEKVGQIDNALSAYMQLIDMAPTQKHYLVVAERLMQLTDALPAVHTNMRLRIALLGNTTLDHLQRYLAVECYRAGLRPTFYQAGFDQYSQEIINPESGLYAFAPDVVIVAIHASRLFPHLHSYAADLSLAQRQDEMEAGLMTLENLLATFAQRSSALVLLNNMAIPQYPTLGILDWRDKLGQTELFQTFNSRIAEMARTKFKNVFIVDEEKVQARCGKTRATDPRLWFMARMAWSDQLLNGLVKEYMRYLLPYKGLNRKCIVLDLDNTLWGGVIGEDGLAGIQLGSDAPGNTYHAFQRELEKMWRRGILLAICSKNNPDDALAVLHEHPEMILKPEHFAAMRINWEPKAENIRQIAAELNIGLDSLVFLDDNPIERAAVRIELPQVLVPEMPADPSFYRQVLLDLPVFDTLALTAEDRNRNKFYAEQKARQEFEAEHLTQNALEDYLLTLEMAVEIMPASSITLPRIAQLTNKTNQFNLTTRRYSEGQIDAMLAQGYHIYSLRVSDRFGDNGLVGVSFLAPKANEVWEIDNLLLSCRVMGRGVETALLAFIVDQARQKGCKRLQGWYLPTAKNMPASDIYRRHGFTCTKQNADGGELWELDPVASPIRPPHWLVVRTAQQAGVA